MKEIRNSKQDFDLPIPSDALLSCELPEYNGWCNKELLEGKAIMILDTETSGVNHFYNSILQLSWQVVDSCTWKVLSEQNFYFKWPYNTERVSPRAIAVNGLTEEKLEKVGTSPLLYALFVLFQDLKNCSTIVGHNVEFDLRFITSTIQFLIKNIETKFLQTLLNDIDMCETFDTMRKTVYLCRINNRNYRSQFKYKYPKLSELANFLNIDYTDLSLHDSSADVELTKRCYRKLVDIEYC